MLSSTSTHQSGRGNNIELMALKLAIGSSEAFIHRASHGWPYKPGIVTAMKRRTYILTLPPPFLGAIVTYTGVADDVANELTSSQWKLNCGPGCFFFLGGE